MDLLRGTDEGGERELADWIHEVEFHHQFITFVSLTNEYKPKIGASRLQWMDEEQTRGCTFLSRKLSRAKVTA